MVLISYRHYPSLVCIQFLRVPPMNKPQSKFQLITETQLPHKCLACGKDATGRNKFVDFGVSFDYEGAIYICEDCAAEIAMLLGFESVANSEALTKEKNALQEEFNDLKAKYDALNNVFITFGGDLPSSKSKSEPKPSIFAD